MSTERRFILDAIDEAVQAGSRFTQACLQVGLHVRTIQRWRDRGGGEDLRRGPKTTPSNKLSEEERQEVLDIATSPELRDLSPKQIVPTLADRERYVASESTFYRILREEKMLTHRRHARPVTRHRPQPYVAVAPNQVWSWDITYLRSALRGSFYYLYMVEDIWSRKVVGWAVHEEESSELAAELIERVCDELGIDPAGLVLHSDNGGPMKGSTMLATLHRMQVVPSFSRPRVSDDNPYCESLFRTMKYRPEYPHQPFESIHQARAWVAVFVDWYNTEHLHSAIGFVTPERRHDGEDIEILARRKRVYEDARRRNPTRWARHTRAWKPVEEVHLNPERASNLVLQKKAA